MLRPTKRNPRDANIHIRVSDVEIESIRATADAKGMPMSVWIRVTLLDAVKDGKVVLPK